MRATQISALILSLLSVIVCAALFWIGLDMCTEAGAPFSIWGFGALSIAYAGLNLAFLALAWRRAGRQLASLSGISALGFYIAVVTNAANGGIDPLERSALVLAAAMLFVNWWAVRRVGLYCRATR